MALDLISTLIGAFLGFLAGMIIVAIIVSIGIYILMSLAYMAIGKKARLKTPGLAWIPGVGPGLIAFQCSKMHWWPWLLIAGMLIPFVNFFCMIVFAVFNIIWSWKMFEKIGRPGWWAILMLIPIVGLILICVAAWSKK